MDKITCGAKSRSNGGQPCKLAPLANGRCRFHGGKTPVKHGFYTKKAIEIRRMIKDMIKGYSQSLQNV